MNLLSVRGLTKTYTTFTLGPISFALPPGRIMGLVGKNGAGKTTTLKAILNLVHPDSGQIEMFGQNFIENEASCKQNVGVVLGDMDFYSHKKLKDITAVTKRFYARWDDIAYENYLKTFDLDPAKKVSELSSGMKVKYLIALALSHHAKLLILDEPTSGLDPVSRDDLLTLFKQLVKSGERSILFSTHITTDLEKCADDITYIKDGKLVKSADQASFVKAFDYLKEADEERSLSIEDIMIRLERKQYDI